MAAANAIELEVRGGDLIESAVNRLIIEALVQPNKSVFFYHSDKRTQGIYNRQSNLVEINSESGLSYMINACTKFSQGKVITPIALTARGPSEEQFSLLVRGKQLDFKVPNSFGSGHGETEYQAICSSIKEIILEMNQKSGRHGSNNGPYQLSINGERVSLPEVSRGDSSLLSSVIKTLKSVLHLAGGREQG